MDTYTYTRHTHTYKVNMCRLYNGVKEVDKTKIVRTRIHKQSYRQTQQQGSESKKDDKIKTITNNNNNKNRHSNNSNDNLQKGKRELDSNNSSGWGQTRGMLLVFCSKTVTMKAADTSPVELRPDGVVRASVKDSFRETNQRKACLLHL